MTKKINIGIMGCAAIAQRSVVPAMLTLPEYNVVAVASRTTEKAEKFAQQFGLEAITGYENLLSRPDIEAIYMPLPTGLHHTWIMKSLAAGKHVLAEKSIAADFASAEEMVALAKKNKLVLMEDFMFQYHSQHKFIFDLIKKGEIGDVRVFSANFGFPPLPDGNFRYNDAVGGGALLDAAGYTVRAVHFVLGDDFTVKAANLKIDPKTGTNIYGSAFLDNGNGISAHASFGFDHYYQGNYQIWGTRGKITADRAFTPRPDFSPLVVLEQQNQRHEYQLAPDNHFVGALREFHRTITIGTPEKHYHDVLLQSKTLDDIRRLSSL